MSLQLLADEFLIAFQVPKVQFHLLLHRYCRCHFGFGFLEPGLGRGAVRFRFPQLCLQQFLVQFDEGLALAHRVSLFDHQVLDQTAGLGLQFDGRDGNDRSGSDDGKSEVTPLHGGKVIGLDVAVRIENSPSGPKAPDNEDHHNG